MSALDDRDNMVLSGKLKLRECNGSSGEIKLTNNNADVANCKSSPPPQVLWNRKNKFCEIEKKSEKII